MRLTILHPLYIINEVIQKQLADASVLTLCQIGSNDRREKMKLFMLWGCSRALLSIFRNFEAFPGSGEAFEYILKGRQRAEVC